MKTTPLMCLDLRTPLQFVKIAELPEKIDKNDEFLLFYELEPVQSRSIEPAKELLLGSLVFTGQKTDVSGVDFTLSAGKYLFSQCRSSTPIEWLDMAIEQQKDGLWERHKPDNKLYIRFLFEDGCQVTQLFRPLSAS